MTDKPNILRAIHGEISKVLAELENPDYPNSTRIARAKTILYTLHSETDKAAKIVESVGTLIKRDSSHAVDK